MGLRFAVERRVGLGVQGPRAMRAVLDVLVDQDRVAVGIDEGDVSRA
jgi:hypothetical protein